ncbi:MAG: hypothetical protein ACTJG4_04195 [Vreelandella alkaliphila]|uniref:hypothetical protein n=1 Tax=Halomonadaceae TaxID=28256 RepID=UPI000E92BBB7|nr:MULTISPECIES: hypothetical protein [unclassified Halomonas]HBP42058.1 hypothetical protein [Halomonas sp.]
MAFAENPHNFTDVDSKEKAIRLVEEGRLVPILLFPAELGGPEASQNTVYVPPETRDIQTQIIGTLIRFVEEGLIDNLNAEPEYKGNSFVPSRIHMRTSHSGKPGQFNPTIEIW